jgi:NAD dependent epimerase/dehydratase
MKKLLITGAAGFIGSHVVEACVEKGYGVRAFVHYNSRNAWGWLDGLPVTRGIEVKTGDIRDLDSVASAMNGCTGVIHLAALIGIPYSYESPLAYIRTNVEGTYNVLQSARTANLEDVIVTSTSEVYGTAQRVPIDEAHPVVGQSPYSASKIAADQLAIAFHRSFATPVKIVRPFNTYGPRQSARAIIPTVIKQILSGKTELELGNVLPTRDLTFVKDTAAAFVSVLESPASVGEVTNVGMGEEISIRDLAGKIARLLGVSISIGQDPARVRPSGSEVERLVSDATKLKRTTAWKPRYSLEQGLEETIRFVREHESLYKDLYNV